jgi:hypothetical protein
MAIKLHRCSLMWVTFGGHPCWRVQQALDEAGVNYEVVPMPWTRWKRDETTRTPGQSSYPWIEFEDGSVYREQSKDMAERIRSGKLDDAPRRQPSGT